MTSPPISTPPERSRRAIGWREVLLPCGGLAALFGVIAIAAWHRQAVELALAAGILVSVLASVLVYVTQMARRRAQELEWENQQRQEVERTLIKYAEDLKAQRLAALNVARDAEEARRALQLLKEQLDDRVAARTAELGTSEERFRRAFEDAGIGMALVGLDGRWLRVNRALCDLVGYAEAELLEKTFQDITHPEDVATTLGHIQNLVTGHARSHRGEKRYFHRDGRVVWIHLTASLVRDAGGQPVHLVLQIEDITARRQAETALRASATELAQQKQALDEHAIVAVTDVRGTITYVNDKFCAISQYARGELLGQNHRLINSGYHSKEFFAEMYRTIGRGGAWQGEIRNRAKDGSIYWVATTIVPFMGPDGKPANFVAIRADITERKRLEESLAEARDVAVQASRMKSEFLANMSHEIRTPMNSVVGMSGLLSGTTLTPEQREMVHAIQSGAESLLTIINDILDFSKVEAGKLRLEPEEFDFREVIEETVALLAPRAHEKGVELSCEIDGNLQFCVLGDGGRVRQVLTNLLGNAIKFTDTGEVAVAVHVVRAGNGRMTLRVTVRDTGVGISAEARERLFQPFSQEESSATRRFGGTGLGLAISRQLVELMGGTIGLKSEPGRGSTFWFEVEFTMLDAAPKLPPLPIPPGRRILVVDDNESNCRIALGQLTRMGVAAEAVGGAAAALARLRDPASGPWHAALLDWSLPDMNGVELATRIRTETSGSGMALVMLSSAGLPVDSGFVAAAGFAGFLTKPVTDAQLHRCLTRVFAEDRAAPTELRVEVAPAGPRLRILLVEDNPANQRVAELLLTALGHDVDVAANGQHGLERLAGGKYDVVLMDCQMPVLDGYEATRRIRLGILPGINPRVPVVALTAYAMADDRAKCMSAGMDEILTKPIRESELRAVLERVVRGAAGGAAAGANLAGRKVAGFEKGIASGVFDAQTLAIAQELPGSTGGSLLPELIARYLADQPAQMENLTRLATARAGGELGDAAHGFASSASVFGAIEVNREALALERAARKDDWPLVTAHLERLHRASATLRDAIEQLNLTES